METTQFDRAIIDPHLPEAPLGELTADVEGRINKGYIQLWQSLLRISNEGTLTLGQVTGAFKAHGVRFSKAVYK